MKTATKFNFKTLTVLILSLVLCCSLAFSAACTSGDNSSSSSSSAKEETVYPSDAQAVTNGDFEFSTFKTEDKNFPVSSSIGWSKSNAATSSKSSGIINTEEDAYNAIAETAGFPKNEDGTYYNPGTPYSKDLIGEDYKYVDYAEGDDFVNDDKLPMKGSKILMIHNVTSTEGEGTAQKFTSSSGLSLSKGTYGKISVWVKTYDLKTIYDVGDNFGAYVAIENTVSSSLSPAIVKNINTKGEWVRYSFYLQANDLTDSSFKIVLGLGFGSSDKFRNQYVEGFAYFDDVTFTEITASEYNEASANKTFGLFTDNGENTEAKDLMANAAGTEFKSNESGEFSHEVYAISHNRNGYSSVKFNAAVSDGEADTKASDVTIAEALAAINATDFASDLEAPVSSGNALYAIKKVADDDSTGIFEYTTASFKVEPGKYYAYTFYVKSYLERKTRTGLTVIVNDLGANGTSDSDKTTTSLISNLCTNDYENEQYKNWQKFTVLVSNTVDLSTEDPADRNFSLTFTFGKDGTENWDKAKGYFAIVGLESKELSETEYNFANTTDAVKVVLTADLPNGTDSESTTSDSYKFSYGTVDSVNIKNGVAKNVLNYTGVVGDSYAVGGKKEENVYSDENVLAGVINTNGLNGSNKAGLSVSDISEIEKLGKFGNEHLQALMINNKEAASFGYYGTSSTLSANTYTLYSVRVKTLGDATAYVYLVDANALDGFNVLSVDGKAHGNVTAVSEKFETKVAKDYQTATDNGWYTVYFLVRTGNESKNVRVELWNGSRDGENTSKGVVLFGSVEKTSLSTQELGEFMYKLEEAYGDSEDNSKNTVTEYTRQPTTVYNDDENGSETYEVDGKKYKYSTETKNYEATAVFTVYEKSKIKIGTYETIDVEHEIDNRTAGYTDSDTDDEEDSSSEEEEDEAGFSWALQITSIIIAAVLIVLLVVVLIRMLVKKSGKNKATVKTYYDRDAREKVAHDVTKASKKKVAAPVSDDVKEPADEGEPEEVKPYDYDNMENNIESEESDGTADESESTEESSQSENTESESSEESVQGETAEENPGEGDAQ